nr:B-cell receptor-associated protein 31-like [Tanacetum cinerariifolium]
MYKSNLYTRSCASAIGSSDNYSKWKLHPILIDGLHHYIRELHILRKTMKASKKQNRTAEETNNKGADEVNILEEEMRPARFDPDSEDKIRWKDMWKVQINELTRSKVNPNKSGRVQGMSWAAQHMKSFRESILERAKHKREYDNRMNERQMQSKEEKIDSSKALDDDLVVTEISGTEPEKHDTSSRSENDTHAEDADIKPMNDKDSMVEVQLTAQNNVLANEQQHSVQSEPIYDTYLLENVDSNITPDSTNMSHKGERLTRMLKMSSFMSFA